MENKKVLAGLAVIAVLILLVYYIPQIAQSNIPTQCLTASGQCEHESYLKTMIGLLPLVLVVGFLIGAGVSYLYFERKIAIPKTQSQEQAMLDILPSDERKVISKLVAEGGRATQAEISRIEGIGKVKAHRIVERLERRGTIIKESSGKTNIIRLKKEIMESVKGS